MGDVRIVAHRGGSAWALENTVAAFQKAANLGVDAVEIDVLPSADGVLVAYHDDSLARLAGVNRHVWELSWDELRGLTLRAEVKPSETPSHIPTLTEVLAILPRRTEMVLDMKHDGTEFPGFADAVASFVRQAGPERVSVLSVHHEFLMDLGRQVPPVRPLFNYRLPVSGSDLPAYDGVAGLALGMKALTPDLLVAAAERKWPVYLWTPNTRQELTIALGLGVHAVITDNVLVAWELREGQQRRGESQGGR